MRKKRFVTRIIIICCIMILSFCLIGCEKKNFINNEEEDESKISYVAQYFDVSLDENMYIGDIFQYNESLYYVICKQCWNEIQKIDRIERVCIQEELSETKLYIDFSDIDVISCCFLQDGRLVYISKLKNEYYLSVISTDGTVDSYIDLSDYLDEDMQNLTTCHLLADRRGNIFFSNGFSSILIFDQDGVFLRGLKIEQESDKVSTVTFGVNYDGLICYKINNNSLQLFMYDEEGNRFKDTISNIPTDCWKSCITPGIQNGILLCGESALIEYNPVTGESNQILKWIDSGIQTEGIKKILVLKDGRIISNYNRNCENEILLLSQGSMQEKTKITIGCIVADYALRNSIANFNKHSETIQVELIEYIPLIDSQKIMTQDVFDQAEMDFQCDIINGNGPDLFSTVNLDIETLIQKGVIENLTPYLERSDKIHKCDLIEQVINAYTMDGCLYAIPKSFHIVSLMGRRADLGEMRGWNLEEMLSYAMKDPEIPLVADTDNLSMLYLCIMYDLDSYINDYTGTCFFDSERFKKVLEFAKTYPNREEIESGKPALLQLVSLQNPTDWQFQEKKYGESVVAIGYPNEERKGNVIWADESLCINNASKNKEAAWAYIESTLNGDKSDKVMGYFTVKSAYDAVMSDAMRIDDDKESTIYSLTDGTRISIDTVTESEVNSTWEAIMNISGTVTYNTQIMDIIEEEVIPYFLNQKEVDEVMKIIQNRVQNYLNEKDT